MRTEHSIVDDHDQGATEPPSAASTNKEQLGTAHDAAPTKPSLVWMIVPVLLIAVALFLAR
jgi:hypothetical protein